MLIQNNMLLVMGLVRLYGMVVFIPLRKRKGASSCESAKALQISACLSQHSLRARLLQPTHSVSFIIPHLRHFPVDVLEVTPPVRPTTEVANCVNVPATAVFL